MSTLYASGALWSTSSNWGTTSGASDGWVPTSADDVVFDANSISMAIDTVAVCKSIVTTSPSGNFAQTLSQNYLQHLSVYGDITWSAGTFTCPGDIANITIVDAGNFTLSGGSFTSPRYGVFTVRGNWVNTGGDFHAFTGAASTVTIQSNVSGDDFTILQGGSGVNKDFGILNVIGTYVSGVRKWCTLLGHLSANYSINITVSPDFSFDADVYNVTAPYLYCYGVTRPASSGSVYMGSGTWTFTDVILYNGSSCIVGESSTLVLSRAAYMFISTTSPNYHPEPGIMFNNVTIVGTTYGMHDFMLSGLLRVTSTGYIKGFYSWPTVYLYGPSASVQVDAGGKFGDILSDYVGVVFVDGAEANVPAWSVSGTFYLSNVWFASSSSGSVTQTIPSTLPSYLTNVSEFGPRGVWDVSAGSQHTYRMAAGTYNLQNLVVYNTDTAADIILDISTNSPVINASAQVTAKGIGTVGASIIDVSSGTPSLTCTALAVGYNSSTLCPVSLRVLTGDPVLSVPALYFISSNNQGSLDILDVTTGSPVITAPYFYVYATGTSDAVVDFGTGNPVISVENLRFLGSGTGVEKILARGTWTISSSSAHQIDLGNGWIVPGNSVFVLGGSGIITIEPPTTGSFNDFTLGGSKAHRFTAGTTIRIDGALSSNGTVSTKSTLISTSPGTKWNLNLQGTSLLTDTVDVTDSDASFGLQVHAPGSTDSGNNTYWLFAALGSAGRWMPRGIMRGFRK